MISIRTKLLVPVSIISLLMMAITAIFIVSRYHAYEVDINTTTEQRVTRLKNALNDIFIHTSGLVENIGTNRLIIDSLLVNNQYDIIENLSPYIELENLDKLVIYTKEGEVFAQMDDPSRFGHTDDLYPWLLRFGNNTETQCISDQVNNQHAVLCGAPIDSINGIIGYAVAGYYLNQSFVEWLQELTFSQVSVNEQLLTPNNNDEKITNLNLFELGLIEYQHHPFYLTLTENLADKNKERDQWILYSIIIIALNVIAISFLFVFFGVISKAILGLNKYARHVEERDFSYSYEPKSLPNDEIGQIVESFHHIAESYEEFAEICESIAIGDIERSINITHAQDNLGIAVNTMVSCLREKTADNVKALAELSNLNEQLHVARKKSERASEEKSIFLATMSHEIRTPLNGIVGMVHQLGKGQLDKNQSQQLEILKTCSTHLLAIIDDILDFSKIEAGKMDLDLDNIDIRLLLESLVAVFINNAREANIDLLYQVAPDVPDIIHVDPTRLRQVLTNLLGNAFKFTKTGEIFVKVSVQKASPNKLQLLFMVTDTGIGIEEDKRSLLFEPFTQADTSMSRRFGGTGLGLAICSRLVNLMGGNIWLGEQTQSGATFNFTVEVDRNTEQQASELRVIEPVLLGRKIVVVIDKNIFCGQVFHQRLTELGMAVATIETSEQALSPESVIPVVDVVLLALDRNCNEAWQYIAMLRKRHHDSPVPIINFVDHDDCSLGQTDTDLCLYLEKPLLHKQLVEKLLSLFSKQPVQQPLLPEPPDGKAYQPSILVVDDNLINQRVILHLLQDTTCKVNTSSNGYEALKILRHSHYDIVLVDIHMPEMDGLTLARKIQQQSSTDSQPWLIAMTADSSDDIQQKSIEAGMQDIVFKPVLLEKLEKIIGDWQKQYAGNDLPIGANQVKHGLLDIEVLDQYRLSTLDELSTLFCESGKRYIHKLQTGYTEKNMAGMSKIVHMLKGSALTMGASHLCDLCIELQAIIDQHQIEGIAPIIDEINQCFNATVVELARQVKIKKHGLDYQ
ncbi:MAG: response regulator [Piscirickettsiaceae bacterium]|nr:response regulator [Piscirickettsiaceae bacterium]